MGVSAEERDPEKLREIHAACDRAVEPLEERLSEGPYLFGERPTLYDITCACRLMALRPPESFLAESQVWKKFAETTMPMVRSLRPSVAMESGSKYQAETFWNASVARSRTSW